MKTINELDNEITHLKEELADKSANLQRLRKDEERKKRDLERKREAEEIEAVKAELAAEYKIERNAKFDKTWSIAWEYGHSSGLDEVKNYFHELVELILP
jgi:flagellar biosynthesis/type III secretory pathway protein FliH